MSTSSWTSLQFSADPHPLPLLMAGATRDVTARHSLPEPGTRDFSILPASPTPHTSCPPSFLPFLFLVQEKTLSQKSVAPLVTTSHQHLQTDGLSCLELGVFMLVVGRTWPLGCQQLPHPPRLVSSRQPFKGA